MVKEANNDTDILADSEELDIPEVLPLLPVRDIVIFPYMIMLLPRA